MTDLSRFLPPDLEQWMERRIAEGHYVDAEDYVRSLIGRDRDESQDETEWLREQIDIGRASGIIDKEPEKVIEEIIARRHARGG